MLKTFYLIMAVIGAVAPWLFFSQFFATEGLNVQRFLDGVFANPAAGGSGMDLLISILVFWVWSFFDARRHGIKRWWLVPPATLAAGLSLSMPLYLYLRHDA